MEARTQSEARQDLDAKLTPIRYDEVIHTQAESYQRRQISQSTRQPFTAPDDKFSDNRSRSTFSALHASNNYEDDDDYNEINDNGYYTNASNRYMPVKGHPTAAHSLNATAEVNPFRSAIAATFRGYCCEQFVFDSCSRRNSGGTYDHSAAGQEICINSFVLLSKRELTAHSQLPQAPPPNDYVTTPKAPSTQSQFTRSNNQVFTQPITYGQSAPLSSHYNSRHSRVTNLLLFLFFSFWQPTCCQTHAYNISVPEMPTNVTLFFTVRIL